MAQIVVEMSSDEAKLYRGFQKIVDQQGKLQDKLKKTGRDGAETGRKLGEAGKKGQRAFGSGAVAQLRNYALGFVGIQRGVSLLTRMFSDLHQEAQKAGEEIKQSFFGIGELGQLTKTGPGMRELTGMAREIRRTGGAETEQQAGELVFALSSAGALEHREMFGQLRARGVVRDPATLAKAAKTMIASMGAEETGTFRDIVSKAFAASEFTPSRVEKLLEAAARPGPAAAMMGISDEEVLAGTAIMSGAMGEAPMAGTYLRRLLVNLRGQPGFKKGRTMKDILQGIAAKEYGFKELQEIVGPTRGLMIYEVLKKNLPQYEKALQEITRAEKEDYVSTKLQLFRADPALKAEHQRRLAEGEEWWQQHKLGTWQTRAETFRSEQRVLMRKERGRAYAWAADIRAGILETLVGPEEFLRRSAPVIEEPTGEGLSRKPTREQILQQYPQLEGVLWEAGEKLNRAADKLERAAGGATLRRPNDDM